MGLEKSPNDKLIIEEFRRLIAQIVREELGAFFKPQLIPEKHSFIRKEDSVNKSDASPTKINSNWLTHDEAATYLKATPAVLYKLTSTRKIKYSKRGKRNYYKVEHLEKYLSEGEIQTKEDIAKDVRLKPKMKLINH